MQRKGDGLRPSRFRTPFIKLDMKKGVPQGTPFFMSSND